MPLPTSSQDQQSSVSSSKPPNVNGTASHTAESISSQYDPEKRNSSDRPGTRILVNPSTRAGSQVIVVEEEALEGEAITEMPSPNNTNSRIISQTVEINDAAADHPVAISEPVISSTNINDSEGWEFDDRPGANTGTANPPQYAR